MKILWELYNIKKERINTRTYLQKESLQKNKRSINRKLENIKINILHIIKRNYKEIGKNQIRII